MFQQLFLCFFMFHMWFLRCCNCIFASTIDFRCCKSQFCMLQMLFFDVSLIRTQTRLLSASECYKKQVLNVAAGIFSETDRTIFLKYISMLQMQFFDVSEDLFGCCNQASDRKFSHRTSGHQHCPFSFDELEAH